MGTLSKISKKEMNNNNPHLQLINSPPLKALRAGIEQGGATKLDLNGTKSAYFGTNFPNWDDVFHAKTRQSKISPNLQIFQNWDPFQIQDLEILSNFPPVAPHQT